MKESKFNFSVLKPHNSKQYRITFMKESEFNFSLASICVGRESDKIKSGVGKQNLTDAELLYIPAGIGFRKVCMRREADI